MQEFRFVILGAGSIAHKFADAVRRTPGASVAAVASKSAEKAAAFAEKEQIGKSYADYEEMLVREKPDAAYIATTVNFHRDLALLCIRHHVPVLCEKAMFSDSAQAQEIFAEAKKEGVFVMEAMWSRFLPHMKKARQWIAEGKLGTLVSIDANLGYCPPFDPHNRFFDRALGGGTGRDLLVYCYELTQMLAGEDPVEVQSMHLNGETGVDVVNLLNLRFSTFLASVRCHFIEYGQFDLFRIFGTDGYIEIPSPHIGRKSILYIRGEEPEVFDCPIENGFVFEVQEVIDCVRAGRLESETVPWKLTLESSKLYDELT